MVYDMTIFYFIDIYLFRLQGDDALSSVCPSVHPFVGPLEAEPFNLIYNLVIQS